MSESSQRIETLLIALAGAAIFSVSRSFFSKAKVAYGNLSDLLGEASKLSLETRRIADELAYMRSMSQAAVEGAMQEQVPSNLQSAQGTAPYAAPPPFPVHPFVAYQPPPDAVVEDTDKVSLTQTDEELTELERLENLRQAGYVLRDDEEGPPQGIRVESK